VKGKTWFPAPIIKRGIEDLYPRRPAADHVSALQVDVPPFFGIRILIVSLGPDDADVLASGSDIGVGGVEGPDGG
jgi:hypothetical protein